MAAPSGDSPLVRSAAPSGVDVAGFDELEDGVPKIAKANGREIILVRWGDRVFALRNICPHQSASFAAGWARRKVCSVLHDSASGSREWALVIDEDEPVILCPWHKWEFHLANGRCTTDPRFRVRSYPTDVVAGRVYVTTRS